MYDSNKLFNAYTDIILSFCRAAQKLNLSSSPHRRRRSGDENVGSDELPIFPNGYAALLLKSPPPAPPALLRRIGVKELTGVGKVSLSIYRYDRASSDRVFFATLGNIVNFSYRSHVKRYHDEIHVYFFNGAF